MTERTQSFCLLTIGVTLGGIGTDVYRIDERRSKVPLKLISWSMDGSHEAKGLMILLVDDPNRIAYFGDPVVHFSSSLQLSHPVWEDHEIEKSPAVTEVVPE